MGPCNARWGRAIVIALALTSCAAEISLGVDLQHAEARAQYQTPPELIRVLDTDVAEAYDVLGDLEVVARQRGAFGEVPTRDVVIRTLQQRSGRLGAHAVVMFECGELGSSVWSYHELRCHGRAVRFR